MVFIASVHFGISELLIWQTSNSAWIWHCSNAFDTFLDSNCYCVTWILGMSSSCYLFSCPAATSAPHFSPHVKFQHKTRSPLTLGCWALLRSSSFSSRILTTMGAHQTLATCKTLVSAWSWSLAKLNQEINPAWSIFFCFSKSFTQSLWDGSAGKGNRCQTYVWFVESVW